MFTVDTRPRLIYKGKEVPVIRFDYDFAADPAEGGIHFPVIVCDSCGQQIVGSGNVYWVWLDEGVHPDLWHTHKWPCSGYDRLVIQPQHPDGLILSEELNRWLDQLVHNFKVGIR